MRDLIYRLRILLPAWLIPVFLTLVLLLAVTITLSSVPNISSIPIIKKTKALKEAVSWELRAFRHSEDGFFALVNGQSTYETDNESGGILLGVTRMGHLVIDTYNKEKNTEAILADLIIDDAAGVASFLDKYKYQHVLMDSYDVKESVMYIVRLRDGTPLNLILIQEGLAHAHPNPPTSIVDRMMATYWWNIFNEKVTYHENN